MGVIACMGVVVSRCDFVFMHVCSVYVPSIGSRLVHVTTLNSICY